MKSSNISKVLAGNERHTGGWFFKRVIEPETRDSLPDDSWTMGCPCMVQPFLPSVVEEGEFTYVFIDGAFSHGVCKRAGPDDYRIQSPYGGYETPYTPDARDLAAAQAVVAALPFEPLLYARIDMVRLPSGTLAVMEAE